MFPFSSGDVHFGDAQSRGYYMQYINFSVLFFMLAKRVNVISKRVLAVLFKVSSYYRIVLNFRHVRPGRLLFCIICMLVVWVTTISKLVNVG